MRVLRVRPGDPLILDRWLDVTYALLWAIYAGWGIATLAVGLPTITANTPEWYSTVWAGSVGILAGIAFLACVSLFFRVGPSFVTKKRIEMRAVMALCLFILVYPALLFSQALAGDDGRRAVAVLAISYVVFPIYRVYVLRQRIRAYEMSVRALKNA